MYNNPKLGESPTLEANHTTDICRQSIELLEADSFLIDFFLSFTLKDQTRFGFEEKEDT